MFTADGKKPIKLTRKMVEDFFSLISQGANDKNTNNYRQSMLVLMQRKLLVYFTELKNNSSQAKPSETNRNFLINQLNLLIQVKFFEEKDFPLDIIKLIKSNIEKTDLLDLQSLFQASEHDLLDQIHTIKEEATKKVVFEPIKMVTGFDSAEDKNASLDKASDCQQAKDFYEKGLEAYLSDEWESAIHFFTLAIEMSEAKKEENSQPFIAECQHFIVDSYAKESDSLYEKREYHAAGEKSRLAKTQLSKIKKDFLRPGDWTLRSILFEIDYGLCSVSHAASCVETNLFAVALHDWVTWRESHHLSSEYQNHATVLQEIEKLKESEKILALNIKSSASNAFKQANYKKSLDLFNLALSLFSSRLQEQAAVIIEIDSCKRCISVCHYKLAKTASPDDQFSLLLEALRLTNEINPLTENDRENKCVFQAFYAQLLGQHALVISQPHAISNISIETLANALQKFPVDIITNVIINNMCSVMDVLDNNKAAIRKELYVSCKIKYIEALFAHAKMELERNGLTKDVLQRINYVKKLYDEIPNLSFSAREKRQQAQELLNCMQNNILADEDEAKKLGTVSTLFKDIDQKRKPDGTEKSRHRNAKRRPSNRFGS